jgi:PAS domain S-box-containing protein
MKPETREQLLLELEELRTQLDEAEDTLRAIRSGEVDALVVSGAGGEQVYTLKGADHSYRVLIEDMNEGALTLSLDGIILYCNRRFAEMLKTPIEKVIGSRIHTWIASDSQNFLHELLKEYDTRTNHRGEATLLAGDGTLVPGTLSGKALQMEESLELICLVVTNLSEQKRTEAIAASEKLAQELLSASRKAHLALMAEIENRKLTEETLLQTVEQLRVSNNELEQFNNCMVERELRMIELKEEINALCLRLGEPLRYVMDPHLDDSVPGAGSATAPPGGGSA